MPTAKTRRSPDIQLFTKEVNNFNIEGKGDVILVQITNGFQPGNDTSNAVKSAPCGHSVDMGAYNHFVGRLSAADGRAHADQIAAGINPTLKTNLFKLRLKPSPCFLIFSTEDKPCERPVGFGHGGQFVDGAFDAIRITVLVKLLRHMAASKVVACLRSVI